MASTGPDTRFQAGVLNLGRPDGLPGGGGRLDGESGVLRTHHGCVGGAAPQQDCRRDLGARLASRQKESAASIGAAALGRLVLGLRLPQLRRQFAGVEHQSEDCAGTE